MKKNSNILSKISSFYIIFSLCKKIITQNQSVSVEHSKNITFKFNSFKIVI